MEILTVYNVSGNRWTPFMIGFDPFSCLGLAPFRSGKRGYA